MAAIQSNSSASSWVSITEVLRGSPKWKLIKICAAHCQSPLPLLAPNINFYCGPVGLPKRASRPALPFVHPNAFGAKLHINEVCYS